ncbi:hypothetical protein [Eisenbergiella porci]|nr:hypothetical protein [Eisenbergiella porci]
MNTEMFSKLPNPHYNRQRRLPSSYTANEVKKLHVTLYLVMDKRAYTFPDSFKDSAESYLSHREKTGIIKKSNKVFSLYLERFFAFLKKENISSLDALSLKDVLDFMASLSCYEKPTVNHMQSFFCLQDSGCVAVMWPISDFPISIGKKRLSV